MEATADDKEALLTVEGVFNGQQLFRESS